MLEVKPIYEAIIDAACQYFSISRDELMRPSCCPDDVYRRRLCFFLIKKETGMSLRRIGSMFGMTGENVRVSVDTIDSTKDVYTWVKRDLSNIQNLTNNL